MRTTGYLTLFSIFFLAFVVSASAQRTRRPAPKPTPRPTPVRAPAVSPEVAQVKQRVANQLHNVNVFVDIMGPVAVGIEANDRDAAARKLKPADVEKNDLNKRKLIAAIRGLRDGLVALETDFRTRPALAQYLTRIDGISTLATRSEDSAIAGRFVEAKEPLRQVSLKLNETLAVLPGPLPPGTTASSVPVNRPPVPNQSSTVPVSNPSRPVQDPPASSAKREPAVGMTTEQVLASTWGAPANKRNSNSPNGTTEVWTYSGRGTIYFFNGRVTQILK